MSSDGSDSSAREITTFCWLPPDSAETWASIDGAFTDSEASDAPTLATSLVRLRKKKRLNFFSAAMAAFSRTERLIMRPSP